MLSDNADRLIASVDAGTNGGTAWTRPSTAPASSPTLLVSNYQYQYTNTGLVEDDTDPLGIDTRTYYDNLGRVAKTVQDATGSAVTTEYGYDGNDNVTYVQADEPGGAYQKTAYIYGVTTTAGDGVNSNDILSAIQHPDPSTANPSSSQQDSYLTNALGDVVQATDRNGNVHQYSYDVLGRLTADNVSTLGAGVDGTVRQITYGYDSQGNNYLITSLNGSGGIVNQVQRVYNGLGQLTGEYQSHNGAVVQGTTPEVQYTYNEMQNGENNSRLTSIVYPVNGSLYYNYNSGLDDRISRLSSLSGSAYVLESYIYLGLNTVVERDHAQNNVNLSYIYQTGDANANHDGGDQYTGLDRFGRVIDQNWVNGTTGTSTDRYQYGYNTDSEVVSRNNVLDAAMNETYSYDNLGQLSSFARGTHTQSWAPDALGNFTSVTTNGTTQTRTANQQNEYTSISGSGTITYDANGNTTADGSGNTFVYDAWNRLVAVKNGTTTLAAYSYDGLDRRITETHGSTTTDLYYSASDQVLEEDVNGVVQAQNVWSAVYVNALVLRDQSSQHNGVLDQRLYVQQDANWNVTALVDSSGNVVERYDYDPFGAQTVLNADFSVRGTSSYNVPYSFQGMRTDSAVGLQFADNRVYSPTLMRWLQTDPLGQAADVNLYRVEGDQPTDMVDPSGLQDPIGEGYFLGVWLARQGFYETPKPGTVNKYGGGTAMYVIGFQKYTGIFSFDTTPEYNKFTKGCIGLVYIRLNSPDNGAPWKLPGTKAYTNLDSALADQKKREKNLKDDEVVVVYAIQHINEKLVKDAVKAGSNEYDLSKLNTFVLSSFNYATAAQTADGTIRFWEWMPGGQSENSGLIVKHGAELPKDDSHGNEYKPENTIYLVVTIKKHKHAMPRAKCNP